MVCILLEIWLINDEAKVISWFINEWIHLWSNFLLQKCRNIPELQLVNGEDWLL